MLPAKSPDRAASGAQSRLSRMLVNLLMKRARVVAAETLAERYRLITLEGPALERVAWIAGQKVQIAMGSAFVTRTYTPIEWNASAGRACILGYAHGDGPGSAWVLGVRPGDECDVFGPRSSLDVRHLPGPLVLLGDETSIGLAFALVQQDPARLVTCGFEVDDVDACRQVAARLGLEDAMIFAKSADGTHLGAMAAMMSPRAQAGMAFVLTGKAGTIQALRQDLKRHGVPAARVATKAYWAPGKVGLD